MDKVQNNDFCFVKRNGAYDVVEVDTNKNVTYPDHYTYGKIECIDFIMDKELNFQLGNAVKYIVRSGRKHENGMTVDQKRIEDLEKAKQYIDFEIQRIKGER